MNVVNVTSINVLDNPCAFSNPFQFEITFECLQELKHDLDWKVIYVGSAESEKHAAVMFVSVRPDDVHMTRGIASE